MNWRTEWKKLAVIIVVFLACFYLPLGTKRFDNAIMESLQLVKWYAQEHVLLCLVPAFFIAGAISVFVSQTAIMKYLGARANKFLAYGMASIYKMGAGLGPATAFLYSGPAINVLAIILTARVLGLELGIARAVGAILFSIIIGLLMHLIYRKEEFEKANGQMAMPEAEIKRPLWQEIIYFACMVGILVFANWGRPSEDVGLWYRIYSTKWIITSVLGMGFAVILVAWFELKWWKIVLVAIPTALAAVLAGKNPMVPFVFGVLGLSAITSTNKGPTGQWFTASWGFAKQILPLLFFGVLIAGALLGRPEHEGLIPSAWVARAVGGNSLWSNLFASIAGAFMYFATLTEVPILQGLIGAGMGKGPALALLLAGPALSLPNMLVIRSVMGTQKTVVYVLLVIVMATISGIIFGAI